MKPMDTKILRILARDGRITNARLSAAVGLSESATLERVRRLESSGAIEGYQARIAPRTMGCGVEALITLQLQSQNPGDAKRLVTAVQKMAEVLWCAQVLGRFDFVLHVAVEDIEALEHFTNEKMVPLKGLGRIETLTVLKMIKRY